MHLDIMYVSVRIKIYEPKKNLKPTIFCNGASSKVPVIALPPCSKQGMYLHVNLHDLTFVYVLLRVMSLKSLHKTD
jgi:hypothetical protein